MEWRKLQNGSDIRGVAAGAGTNLSPDTMRRLGGAFAFWLADRLHRPCSGLTVSAGRDSRLSGPTLLSALMGGMASAGVRVLDFGLASTPAMFMSTVTPGFDCDGAVMLTASHLPPERNGCKFFTARGGLDAADITDLLARAEQLTLPVQSAVGVPIPTDFMSVYADQLVNVIREGAAHPEHPEAPLRGLHVVVDAGNGAGGFFVDRVLQPLGADTRGSQFLEPDGHFPNHVPNPEHPDAMAVLSHAVLEQRADFGIIFDPDVDRAAAVEANGREIHRNRLVALAAAMVLREHPGTTVVTDSITSDGLSAFIEDHLGGIHHRFRRGYRNVINEAIRLNAEGHACWLAIETSGHAALRENHFLDDGAFLVAKLLVELARARRHGRGLTDLIAGLREPAESQEFRIPVLASDFAGLGAEVIDTLRQRAVAEPAWSVVPDTHEGVRVSCRDPLEQGWFLLRLSLHDPVLPLNIESEVEGGVARIGLRLRRFLEGFEGLDLMALPDVSES